MPNPKTSTTDVPESDETYVSPLFDDSIAERFEQIEADEALISDSALIARLRSSGTLFDDLDDETA